MKVNVSIDDELMNKIDACADRMFLSRSGFISLACSSLVNQQELTSAVQDMAVSMRRIADNGVVDDETLKDLEHLEALSKMFTISR